MRGADGKKQASVAVRARELFLPRGSPANLGEVVCSKVGDKGMI